MSSADSGYHPARSLGGDLRPNPGTLVARLDSAPATGAPFLVRLRSETRALHASTERRIAPAVRLHDVHAYASLLSVFYPLYAGIEDGLDVFVEWRALDPPLDVWRRRRSHLLAADLRALGVETDPGHAGEWALPRIGQFASAFGALYVLEGSRLGGRVLARQVSAAVGAPAEGALSFLRGGGSSDAGALWKEFRAALDGYAARGDARTRDAIVSGAVDTFGCFDRRLAHWDP